MPDRDCEEACVQAYQESIRNCYRVLFEGLATAKSEAEREQCNERFNRCMQLCRDARKACLDACNRH